MNNQIKAEIIKDSINPNGRRITTFILEFPRMILAELNTHRVFSKNSASSRAIPFNKMLKSVQEEPFIPIAFQKHHSGMQGENYLVGTQKELAVNKWLLARDKAVETATSLYNEGVTKQLCNRILEPFLYHKVLLTATEFENFFDLRCPKYELETPFGNSYYKSKKSFLLNVTEAGFEGEKYTVDYYKDFSIEDWLSINKGQAEIHMMDLAEKMYDAYYESKPEILKAGDWHIPYGDNIMNVEEFKNSEFYDKNAVISSHIMQYLDFMMKVAVARCARVSYQTVGDNPTIDYAKDIALYDSLKESKHWSPFEHIAKATSALEYISNFKGYSQLRHILTDKN